MTSGVQGGDADEIGEAFAGEGLAGPEDERPRGRSRRPRR